MEINFKLDDGRHAGHEHTYVVYWIGGESGLQFNKLVSDAAVRTVTITKTRKEQQDEWQPSSRTDEWPNWQKEW